jgi:hypothetical protein
MLADLRFSGLQTDSREGVGFISADITNGSLNVNWFAHLSESRLSRLNHCSVIRIALESEWLSLEKATMQKYEEALRNSGYCQRCKRRTDQSLCHENYLRLCRFLLQRQCDRVAQTFQAMNEVSCEVILVELI